MFIYSKYKLGAFGTLYIQSLLFYVAPAVLELSV